MASVFDGVEPGEGGPRFVVPTEELDEEGRIYKLLSEWIPGKEHPELKAHEDARSDHAIIEALALDIREDEEVALVPSSKRWVKAIGEAGWTEEGMLARCIRKGEGMDTTYEVVLVEKES